MKSSPESPAKEQPGERAFCKMEKDVVRAAMRWRLSWTKRVTAQEIDRRVIALLTACNKLAQRKPSGK